MENQASIDNLDQIISQYEKRGWLAWYIRAVIANFISDFDKEFEEYLMDSPEKVIEERDREITLEREVL
jgi:uncharacterized protein YeeX (DUF496 family)